MASNLTVTDARPLQKSTRAVSQQDQLAPATTILPVAQVDVPKFTENPQGIEHEDEYPRNGSDPGLVVIFNQQTFDGSDELVRLGTNRDVNELIVTFGRLGYNIEERYIYSDLRRCEILKEIKDLSSADYSDRNCLIVIVLTHGCVNNTLDVRDGLMNTAEFWSPFSNKLCPSFRNKPKFFIFQTCKGSKYSQRTKIVGPVIPTETFQTPLEPDFLISFAAELCRNFNTHGRRDDVISLLLRIAKCVAYNYYHLLTENGKEIIVKQMPLLISTLTKKFYLCKSKDRNLLLQLQKKQEEILQLVEEALNSS
ncbi:hypothetical protein RI129_011185 [Pyrocoelia pectoralis]|uniref:Caspase-3 n=1 Tax=Pyrocoelia pectoralis TaxID=417401 RepID=A0AAN7V5T0_9COLE